MQTMLDKDLNYTQNFEEILEKSINVLKKLSPLRSQSEIEILEKATNSIPFFQNIRQNHSQAILELILQRMQYQYIEPLQPFIEADDKITKFYVVLQGSLTMRKERQKSNLVNNGVKKLTFGCTLGEECLDSAEEQYCSYRIAGGPEGCECGYIDRFENEQLISKMNESAIIEKVNFFKQLPFFSYWNQRDLRKVGFSVTGQRFRRNQVVYEEQSEANLIYFVKQGEFVLNAKIRPAEALLNQNQNQTTTSKTKNAKQSGDGIENNNYKTEESHSRSPPPRNRSLSKRKNTESKNTQQHSEKRPVREEKQQDMDYYNYQEEDNDEEEEQHRQQQQQNLQQQSHESDKLLNFIQRRNIAKIIDNNNSNNNVSSNSIVSSQSANVVKNIRQSSLNKDQQHHAIVASMMMGHGSGNSMLQMQSKQICILSKNEVFGEERFFKNHQRFAEAVCTSLEGEVYCIAYHDLKDKLNTMAHKYTEILRTGYEWRLKRAEQLQSAFECVVREQFENADFNRYLYPSQKQQQTRSNENAENGNIQSEKGGKYLQSEEDEDVDASALQQQAELGDRSIVSQLANCQKTEELIIGRNDKDAERKKRRQIQDQQQELLFKQQQLQQGDTKSRNRDRTFDSLEKGINSYIENKLHGNDIGKLRLATDSQKQYIKKSQHRKKSSNDMMQQSQLKPQYYLPMIQNLKINNQKKMKNDQKKEILQIVKDNNNSNSNPMMSPLYPKNQRSRRNNYNNNNTTTNESENSKASLMQQSSIQHYDFLAEELLQVDDKGSKNANSKSGRNKCAGNAVRIIKLQAQIKGIVPPERAIYSTKHGTKQELLEQSSTLYYQNFLSNQNNQMQYLQQQQQQQQQEKSKNFWIQPDLQQQGFRSKQHHSYFEVNCQDGSDNMEGAAGDASIMTEAHSGNFRDDSDSRSYSFISKNALISNNNDARNNDKQNNHESILNNIIRNHPSYSNSNNKGKVVHATEKILSELNSYFMQRQRQFPSSQLKKNLPPKEKSFPPRPAGEEQIPGKNKQKRQQLPGIGAKKDINQNQGLFLQGSRASIEASTSSVPFATVPTTTTLEQQHRLMAKDTSTLSIQLIHQQQLSGGDDFANVNANDNDQQENFNIKNNNKIAENRGRLLDIKKTTPQIGRSNIISNNNSKTSHLSHGRNIQTLQSTINQYRRDKTKLENLMHQVRSFSLQQQLARTKLYNERTSIAQVPPFAIVKPILHPILFKAGQDKLE